MTFKLLLFTAILAVLLVFALQNGEPVKVHFLVWTFSLSSALLVLIPLVFGFFLGWGLHAWGHYRGMGKKDPSGPQHGQ